MIVHERALNGGTQAVHRFDNGYGASVIRGGNFAYGGLELAVLKFSGDDWSDFMIHNIITDDVLGYLTDKDLVEILKRIEAL